MPGLHHIRAVDRINIGGRTNERTGYAANRTALAIIRYTYVICLRI